MTAGGRAVAVALALLLVTTGIPGVAVAQADSGDGGTASGPCEGLPPGASWVCEGLFGIVEWVVGQMQSLVQGMFEAVVEFIVATPAPYADGEMALVEQPDNPPWTALYDLYLTKTLPIGVGLWAVIVLLVQFTELFTHTAGGEYQRSRLKRRAAFGILMLVAWWPVGAFALHLANALTTTIAPSGAQMVGTISEYFANIEGGLIVAILLYLSSGVVAFLLVALFLARFVVVFTLMPAMPVLIPLWIVDEGPLQPLSEVAESIGGLFVPFVFMTLPTAAILLVGYSIQDSLRVWLASIPVIGGVTGSSAPATSAYAIILFLFWVMALIAPLFVLFGRRGLFPLAYLSAGFLAGRSLSTGRGRRSGVTLGGEQSTTGAASGGGAEAAGGQATTLPRPLERGPPARPNVGGTGGGTSGAGSSSPTGGGSDGVTIGDRSDLGEDYPIRAHPTTWRDLDEKLPDNRQYKFGFSRDGEFQPLSTGPPNTNKDTILSGRVNTMADSGHFAGQSDMYLRDDQGEYYDLTSLLEKAREEARVDREAREVVQDAREYGRSVERGRRNYSGPALDGTVQPISEAPMGQRRRDRRRHVRPGGTRAHNQRSGRWWSGFSRRRFRSAVLSAVKYAGESRVSGRVPGRPRTPIAVRPPRTEARSSSVCWTSVDRMPKITNHAYITAYILISSNKHPFDYRRYLIFQSLVYWAFNLTFNISCK